MNSYQLKLIKMQLESGIIEEKESAKEKIQRYEEYRNLLLEKSKLEEDETVRRYLEILSMIDRKGRYCYGLDDSKIEKLRSREVTEKTVLSSSLCSYLKSIKVNDQETNGIYVFEGSYSTPFGELHKTDCHPEFNVYWNLELPKPHRYYHVEDGYELDEVEKVVHTISVPEFERTHRVFKFKDGFDFDKLQVELIGDMLETSQEEAVKRFVKKYESKRIGK